jgi:hypothetical protein
MLPTPIGLPIQTMFVITVLEVRMRVGVEAGVGVGAVVVVASTAAIPTLRTFTKNTRTIGVMLAGLPVTPARTTDVLHTSSMLTTVLLSRNSQHRCPHADRRGDTARHQRRRYRRR